MKGGGRAVLSVSNRREIMAHVTEHSPPHFFTAEAAITNAAFASRVAAPFYLLCIGTMNFGLGAPTSDPAWNPLPSTTGRVGDRRSHRKVHGICAGGACGSFRSSLR